MTGARAARSTVTVELYAKLIGEDEEPILIGTVNFPITLQAQGGGDKPPRMPPGDDPRAGDPIPSLMGAPQRIRRVCRRKGHRWRQKVWGMVGAQVCTRWGCDAEREDPRGLPPEELREHEHDASCSFGNPTCPLYGEGTS